MTTLDLPAGLTSVDTSLCYQCTKLTSVTIPDGVNSIETNAFANCSSLSSITIPSGVTSIGEGAFSNTLWLKAQGEFVIINGLLYLYQGKGGNVIIPEGVSVIGPYSFMNNKTITSVIIPFGVTDISCAFQGCERLSSVTIPESVTDLSGAFDKCIKLKSIDLPDSVINIFGAFQDCIGLSSVTVPEHVRDMRFAFRGCTNLTTVNIPDGVTSLSYTFSGCQKLNNVTIPTGVTDIDHAFYRCSALSSLTLPDSIVTIPYQAFYGCGIKNIVIPSSVTKIDTQAFRYSSLTSVEIPATVTAVQGEAFQDCSSLKSVSFLGDAPVQKGNGYRMFANDTLSVYYPAGNSTWSSNVRSSYGMAGRVTWVPMDMGTPENLPSGVVNLTYGTRSHSFYYDDSFFYNNNQEYNNSLAIMSFGMMLAAFSKNEDNYNTLLPEGLGGYTERAECINQAYHKIGFTDAQFHHYGKKLSDPSDLVAYSFAKKTISNGTSTDTLVVIPVRGGGYGAEWASNFRVYTSGNSWGFDQAALDALKNLKEYLKSIEITGDLKLWITGYSRGAGVANILAHYINEESSSGTLGVELSLDNIYTYGFATPNGAYGSFSANDNNIFSVVSANDAVPKIPLASWGFRKYGQVKILPTYLFPAVASEYQELTGDELITDELAKLWAIVTDSLTIAAPSRSKYFDYYQDDISHIFQKEFSKPNGDIKAGFTKMAFSIFKNALADFRDNNDNVIDIITYYRLLKGYNIICNILDKEEKIGNPDGIGGMHIPEHYLSWLEFGRSYYAEMYAALSPVERDVYDNLLNTLFEITYQHYRIYCPVDVNVYSASGELLVSIIDNQIVKGELPCSVNGDEKSIYLLGDASSYHIELIGNDTGSMSYFVDEYNNSSEIVRSVYYYDIPLTDGVVYEADVSTQIENGQEDYSVTDGQAGVLKALDTLTDTPESYFVEVENGAADNTIAMVGQAVMLYAAVDEDHIFVRWESDDTELSFDNATSENTFIQMPQRNVQVRAVILEKSDIPTSLTASYGQTLTDVTLPNGWAWDDATTSVGNVGEHTFPATFTTETSGTISIDLTVTVNRAVPTATQLEIIVPSTLVYSGNAQEVTVAAKTGVSGLGDITVMYHQNDADVTPISAGQYTFTVELAEGDNYEATTLEDESWAFTIEPLEIGLQWENVEFTYDNSPHVPTATATGLIEGDTCLVTVTGEQTAVGTYTATASAVDNPNYKLPEDAEQTFVIQRTGAAYTIPDELTATYGDTLADISLPDGWMWDEPATSVGNAGEHTFSATFTPEDTGSYAPVTEDLTVTVNRAVPTAALLNVTVPNNPVYSGTAQEAAAVAKSNVDGLGAITIRYTQNGKVASPVNAGNYTFAVELTQGDNYEAATLESESWTLTIKPKEIGLTWSNTSFTYDGKNHIPTAAATGLIEGDECRVTVTGEQSAVGTYTAKATAVDNTNYKLPKDTEQTFVIQRAGAAYTIPDGLTATYGDTLAKISLPDGWVWDEPATTVGNAGEHTYSATFTPEDASSYAPVTEDLTVTVNRAVPTAALLNVTVPNNPVYSGTAQEAAAVAKSNVDGLGAITIRYTQNGKVASPVNAGNYTFAVELAQGDNYEAATLESESWTFTIKPKEIRLTWSNTSFTYDGKSHSPTATVNGMVNGDTCTVNVSGAQKHAGTYTATVTGLNNSNYKLPTSKTQSFTIAQREVGLSWDNISFTYDGQNHSPTATATGLVNGDTCTVTVSGTQKNAGSHTATATGLNNGNYKLPSCKTQNFTIAQREVVLRWSNTSFTYDKKSHIPTATATGLVGSDTCTVNVSGAKTNAGTYTATATKLSNNNYKLPSEKTSKFTIKKATVSVISTASVVQGRSTTLKVKGGGKATFKSGNTKIATVSSKGVVKGIAPGKVTITVTVAGNSNYNKATKKVTVTVKPAAPAITSVLNVKNKPGSITAKWRTVSGVTGFEIQCSMDKTFKAGVKKTTAKAFATTASFQSLTKNKTWYVRIRCYKTISGKKVYSTWSTVKSVKLSK